MIDELVQSFRASDLELDGLEIAEAIWLAPFLGSIQPLAAPMITSQGQTATQSRDSAGISQEESVSSETENSQAESLVEAGVPHAAGVPTKGGRQVPFRSPTASALPHTLQLGRALRPLRRRVDSPHRLVLDEEASVERIARTGLWTPVLRSPRSRWLEVALVVDASRSMSLWRRTILELCAFLRHHGAFRDVRTWSITTEGEAVRLYRGLDGANNNRPERHPRELLDPSRRRLVLVASDCVSPAWHTGRIAELFDVWGQHLPVAILDLLPQRVWLRTALRRYPALWLHGSAPGLPNTRLTYGPSAGLQCEKQSVPHESMPIPVVVLEEESFAAWAEVVVGKAGSWSPGILLRQPKQERNAGSSRVDPNARALIKHFDVTASPLARRLARLLAAAPLTLDVMHLVREVLLPEAGHVHLAEVFLSGLLVECQVAAPQEGEVQYDFAPGVRRILQQSSPFPDSLQVLRCVSEMIERKLGRTFDFSAMLMDPTAGSPEQIGEAHWAFAKVAADILTQLGGEYRNLAARMVGAFRSEPKTQRSSSQRRGVSKPAARKTISRNRSISAIQQHEWPEECGVNAAHTQGIRGAGVILGMLDTGVDAGHPEHSNKVIQFRYVSLFPNSPHQPSTDMHGFDADGHGTHVAGIAAGTYLGVAPDVDLYVASVMESESIRTTLGRWAAGMDWMLQQLDRPENINRPAILLMSGGFPIHPPPGVTNPEYRLNIRALQTLVRRIQDRNVLTIAPVGLGGAGTAAYPAIFPDVLAVGAVDYARRVASFSASGVIEKRSVPDVMGYGVNVYSATMRRSNSQAFYERMSGTSMAAAYVAGIAALYRCRSPDLTALEVRDLILGNALKLPKVPVGRAGKGLAVFR